MRTRRAAAAVSAVLLLAACSQEVRGVASPETPYGPQLAVDLSGSGVPEWALAYSDATAPDGRPVDIAGDAFLRLRVRSDASGEGQGASRSSLSLGPIAEVRTVGAADGYEEVLIGVRGGELPFSAQALTDPGRIVIDFPC
jgi:hypothetical protein